MDALPGETVKTTLIEIDVEKENCVAKVVNNMVLGTQQFISNAKEKILGDMWWIPADDREIVAVPSNALKKLIVKKESDVFLLNQCDYTSGTLYQVCMKWKNNSKRLSILRSKQMREAKDFYDHLTLYDSIFPFVQHLADLKTLLTLITQHSSWLPVHLAAKMGLSAYFEKAKEIGELKKLLRLTCQPEQRLPLHIAIEHNHVDLAKYLLGTKETTIDATDSRGQNALHFAALASSQMVQVLCEFPEAKECINRLNNDGYTPLFLSIRNCRATCIMALYKQGAVFNILCQGRSPLHEAMLQNKSSVKEVIKTLVETSPEMITEADPSTKSSALHLATNKTSLSAFLEVCANIDLNILNSNGRTALHCHTSRGDLGCVVALATYNADLDAKDQEGNTALHLAVYKGDVDLIKGLLVLGADPNRVNTHGHSPRHLAARSKDKMKDEMLRCLIVCEAKRCAKDTVGCCAICIHQESETEMLDSASHLTPETKETQPPVQPNFEVFLQNMCIEKVKAMRAEGKNMQVLLALDGGGIRGLILVMILMFIEKELGEPIINYIDWMGGTSTGAFMSAGMAVGKSLRDCKNLYLRFKDQLFESWSRPYNTEVLEKLIKTEMGEATTMANIERPKLMITTTAADCQPVKLHLFRSYRLPLTNEENDKFGYPDPKDTLLWKALRCSSAAPTYFSTVDNKYVDGGLVSNNPTTELMSEVHRFSAAAEFKKKDNEKVNVGCVLSIGTGRIPDTALECLNISTFNPLDTMTALKNLSILLVDQVTATEGLPVERARSWCHDLRVPYFRFSTPLSKEYVLDTKEDKEVVQMMWETVEYMCRERDQVQMLVGLLKALKGNSPFKQTV